MRRIYLAGGWFTHEQEEEHTRIYNLIKDKFDVFNPRLEGIVHRTDSDEFLNKILQGNIDGIKNADLVLVIYDYKDTGTIWESGFAYASKRPIIYYAETLKDKKFNIMLSRTGHFASNEEELIKLLENDETFVYQSVYTSYKGDIE